MKPSNPLKRARIIKTVCQRDCPDSCFVDVVVEDGKIVSTQGSRENPITQGFLCPRGFGDPERVYSKERVLYPHVREGNGFVRVSWSKAIDLISSKIKDILENFGRESILLYDYPGNQGFLSG